MLDDIVVFIIAMVTMKAVGLHGKYARYSHLIGGVIMLLIGLAMLFKPELIMFFWKQKTKRLSFGVFVL